MIVLDASAALDLVLCNDRGRAAVERIAPGWETLHAPHLIDLEVAQVLRRWRAREQLDPQRADQALGDFLALDLARYPHDALLRRIWELRANATAYDAAYLSLAEALRAPLLTSDARLAEVPGVRARVVVL